MSQHSRLYEFLKYLIVYPMINGYYRRAQSDGYEKVPKDAPVIFAGNHQNALSDALNAIYAVDHQRQITFLARSDIFNTRFRGLFLGLFKMLPIYRRRDKLPNIRELNEQVFQRCVEILGQNDTLLIFPEGNHDRTQRLRPLKKGIVRFGFQAAEDSNYQNDIYIVPIGFTYNGHTKFHRDIFINFGDPINLKQFYELYQESESKAFKETLKTLHKELSKKILHIENKEFYPLIRGVQLIYTPEWMAERGLSPKNLKSQLESAQHIAYHLEKEVEADHTQAEKLQKMFLEYEAGMKRLKMRDHTFYHAPHSLAKILWRGLWLLIGLPVFIYGLINNYVPYRISWFPSQKYFKDDHFHSSVTIVLAYFSFIVFYLLQFIAVWIISGKFWIAALYLASIAITGRFAIRYSEWIKKWWSYTRFSILSSRKDALLLRTRDLRDSLLLWARKAVKSSSQEVVSKI